MTELSRAAVVDAVRYFDTWLSFRQRYARIPGIQAAVLYGDEVLLSSAYGVADLESDSPLTPRHLFRVASHSKTFTATAVLQLVERGSLRLDDTVAQWLPFLRESPLAEATVQELLAHGAGVTRDGRDGDHWQLFREFPDEAAVQAMGLDDADVLPISDRFKYSNVGYSLLGMVIAAASGQPYNAYVREHIVDRLELADTGPEYEPARAGEYATGYSALAYAERRIPIEHVDTAAMAAATGFYSTAEDLVRYAAGHFHGDERLLTDTSKRRMQRSQWTTGRDSEYGLGFDVSTVGDRRVVGHGGGYPGHITNTKLDPVDRLAVSVLTNAIDGAAGACVTTFFRLLGLALDPADSEPVPEGVDLDRFRGRFASLWSVTDVARFGDRLYLLDPTADDPTHEPTALTVVDDRTLRMMGENGFGSRGEPMRYTFGDDGIESVRGSSGGTGYPYDRFAAAAAARDRITIGRPLIPTTGDRPAGDA
ncbi:serine hydrolase domain-containing protein [Nocardioides speluncae]|uniref:serine hydrolase domain-containing protein n=1 Tax=Nocardioides speluncae TaxID=2670337 RepID=UPI000D686613|nr:serine hydrolase domain-containing protein [Nocardioides speluncae]